MIILVLEGTWLSPFLGYGQDGTVRAVNFGIVDVHAIDLGVAEQASHGDVLDSLFAVSDMRATPYGEVR